MATPGPRTVTCPVCSHLVFESCINEHLDNGCTKSTNSGKTLKRAGPSSPKVAIRAGHKGTKSTSNFAPIFAPQNTEKANAASSSSTATISNAANRKREGSPVNVEATSDHPPKRSKPLAQAPNINAVPRALMRAPLAERLRPQSLTEYVGYEDDASGAKSIIFDLLSSRIGGSVVFWGPPGCGKTTLAKLIAKQADAIFKELSATASGTNEVRAILEEAKNVLMLTKRRTILFLDEIHRFNRSQQDIFLPYIEQGQIQLIGATTENPSFKLNSALLSRCRVVVLDRLSQEQLHEIIKRAMKRITPPEEKPGPVATDSDPDQPVPHEKPATSSSDAPPYPSFPQITPKVVDTLISLASGDARVALSLLELALSAETTTAPDTVIDAMKQSLSTSYDRTGDSRYDMISAFHKSIRGGQPSAAMYWLARMLTAGEDPVYVARRLVVCASEDIGLADPHGLPLAMAALTACQNIGMPECRINLAHVTSYLALAPKSTRAYEAYDRAQKAAKRDLNLPVPMVVRNAPTKLMGDLGYAEGYMYNPDFLHPVHNEYLPPEIKGQVFLRPDGDTTGKKWDEKALQIWEQEENEGKQWDGRTDSPPRKE